MAFPIVRAHHSEWIDDAVEFRFTDFSRSDGGFTKRVAF